MELEELLSYVKQYLEDHNCNKKNLYWQPYRLRSEHTIRVIKWVKRIIESVDFNEDINTEILYYAAVFHDVGYATTNIKDQKDNHANRSAEIFTNYAREKDFKSDTIKQIVYIIMNHSNKELIKDVSIPIELRVLLEADMLDEEGALSIVFDCLSCGYREIKTYEDTAKHLGEYSARILNGNPMVSIPSRRMWHEKQMLVRNFLESLEIDLGHDISTRSIDLFQVEDFSV